MNYYFHVIYPLSILSLPYLSLNLVVIFQIFGHSKNLEHNVLQVI